MTSSAPLSTTSGNVANVQGNQQKAPVNDAAKSTRFPEPKHIEIHGAKDTADSPPPHGKLSSKKTRIKITGMIKKRKKSALHRTKMASSQAPSPGTSSGGASLTHFEIPLRGDAESRILSSQDNLWSHSRRTLACKDKEWQGLLAPLDVYLAATESQIRAGLG